MTTKVYMYSVHDKNTGYFNLPFYASCDLEAKHRLAQTLKLDQVKELKGLELVRVGSFDMANGVLETGIAIVQALDEEITEVDLNA